VYVLGDKEVARAFTLREEAAIYAASFEARFPGAQATIERASFNTSCEWYDRQAYATSLDALESAHKAFDGARRELEAQRKCLEDKCRERFVFDEALRFV
jgi:hypothetical protein